MEPTINLTQERVACTRHLEPFRTKWPNGLELFAHSLLDQFAKDRGFFDLVEATPDNATLIEATLDEHPLCEQVSTDNLRFAYLYSGIGTQHRCVMCHKRDYGTRLLTTNPNGRVEVWRHVCFSCFLDQMGGRVN